jgi:DHA3 family multidrug efflux protein-like MFS transporter
MAPLVQTVFIPLMTTGSGVQWIGVRHGTGTDRGIGLMFTLAGLLGVVDTVGAWASKSYRRLSGAAAAPDGA